MKIIRCAKCVQLRNRNDESIYRVGFTLDRLSFPCYVVTSQHNYVNSRNQSVNTIAVVCENACFGFLAFLMLHIFLHLVPSYRVLLKIPLTKGNRRKEKAKYRKICVLNDCAAVCFFRYPSTTSAVWRSVPFDDEPNYTKLVSQEQVV